MDLTLRETTTVAAPIDDVYARAVLNPGESLRLFTGYAFIPAITGYQTVSGDGIGAGSTRLVRTSDGREIEETIVVTDRPHRFVYETAGFGRPFSLLVKAGRGEFQYADKDQRTQIDWTYRYTLTSALAWPVAVVVLRFFFRRAMRICLANTREAFE